MRNMRNPVALVLLASCMVVFFTADGHHDVVSEKGLQSGARQEDPRIITPTLRVQSMREKYHVPVPDYNLEYEFVPIGGMPHVDPQMITATFRFMLSLEGNVAFTSPDDIEIFQLLKDYGSGAKKFKVVPGIVRDGVALSRAAYNCSFNTYRINQTLRPTVELLALTMYHELMHGVQCRRRLKAAGLGDDGHAELVPGPEALDVCAIEAPAYAAQVRFFSALKIAGKLPKRMSVECGSDVGTLNQTMEVWNAFEGGTFCSWLGITTYVTGGDGVSEHVHPVEKE